MKQMLIICYLCIWFLTYCFMFQLASSSLTLVWSLPEPAAEPQQVSDLVDRLIRNRNPGAVFTTTERYKSAGGSGSSESTRASASAATWVETPRWIE